MKKIALIVLAFAAVISAFAANIPISDENLSYKVLFKWGLVNKTAGRVNLKMHADANNYNAVLYARSEPWADKIYSLRDTLTSVMNRTTLVPKYYERIAHEGGHYVCDRIQFTQFKNDFSAECTRVRLKKGETEPSTKITNLTATGMTVDFISAFYYLRTLNFPTMLPGHSVTINIFSGRRKELLRFAYKGIETVEVEGRKYNAYKVEFTFTSDGKKKPATRWLHGSPPTIAGFPFR